MKGTKVNIELTEEEAIVLFEFLVKFNKTNDLRIFEDQAEQRVFWNIESILEQKLSKPFHENYKQYVKKAREIVRDKME